jgi:hypothetical protein
MTDPGLNQRLRQRSRRAGIMIGISMALTIAVLIGGFSVIYAALDNTVGDFISRDVPDPIIPTPAPTESTLAQTDNPAEDTEVQPEATEEAVEDEPEPSEVADEPDPDPTEDADGFVPDFQSSTQARLNFRMEPSSAGGESTVELVLPEGTLLQFTGETEASVDPEVDGVDGWMRFQLEDGTEGWLRAIDVIELEP